MAISPTSPEDILTKAKDYLRANTNLTNFGNGSKIRSLLEIFKEELGITYLSFSSNQMSSFIYWASGVALDFIGETFGVKRKKRDRAYVYNFSENIKFYPAYGTFGDINNGNSITLPAHTLISGVKDGTKVFYSLPEATMLPAEASEVYVKARAVYKGVDSNVPSNTLKTHDFKNYAMYGDRALLVTNMEPIFNGSDEESDDEFKTRIMNSFMFNRKANAMALKLAAMSVPGVADIVVRNYINGVGTVTLLVVPIDLEESDHILSLVDAQVRNITASGTILYLEKPIIVKPLINLAFDFRANTSESDKTNLRDLVRYRVSNYINNIGIGKTIDIANIYNSITSVSNKIIPLRGYEMVTVYIDGQKLTGTKEMAFNEILAISKDEIGIR